MKASSVFEVFEDARGRLHTLNLVPGKTVYEEMLVKDKGKEYRAWDPKRSKLGAAIVKGCSNVFIRKAQTILYLGCSTGTTVSHVSDMVGKEGLVYALDFAPRVMREMVFVSEDRPNIAPIMADANRPDKYVDRVSTVDIVYQDIAQRNQVEIFLKNVNLFLKDDGYGLLAIKARSVDVTKRPKAIFSLVKGQLENVMTIVDVKVLDPLQKDHAFFIVKKSRQLNVSELDQKPWAARAQ